MKVFKAKEGGECFFSNKADYMSLNPMIVNRWDKEHMSEKFERLSGIDRLEWTRNGNYAPHLGRLLSPLLEDFTP